MAGVDVEEGPAILLFFRTGPVVSDDLSSLREADFD